MQNSTMSLPDAAQLADLDTRVEDALRTGSSAGLPVIGFGEVTTVLAWPPDSPTWAAKRLPRFADATALDGYSSLVEDYCAALRARGLSVVPTAVVRIDRDEPRPRAFMVQPLSARDTLLTNVLRDADDEQAAAWMDRLVALAAGCVDGRVGLDAQVSNWSVDGDTLLHLDVSTPFLRDADGRHRLDLDVVLAVYPAGLQPLLRRAVAPALLAGYHDLESVLADVGGNLLREGLGQHAQTLADVCTRRGVRVDVAAMRRNHRRDRRIWRTLNRLKSLDRTWQRSVRRRPYPFLLPELRGVRR